MPISIIAPPLEKQERFLWSSFTRADLQEVHALFQSVNRADDGDHNQTLQDLERQYEDPWFNPKTDARVVRNAWGKLVAFARVLVNPKPQRENVAFIECDVAPDARGQGLEQALVDWAEQNAAARLAQTAQNAAGENVVSVMRAGVLPQQRDMTDAYRMYDFHPVRAFYNMQRDLREPIPQKTLPEGFALRAYDASLDEKLWRAYNEAFDDHWGFSGVTRESWLPHVIGVSSVRQDLSFVVMDGEQIAAFCINAVRTAENERLGIRRGWTTKLGTRRAWRKRGLATFLLAESMRRFRAEGFDYAGLGVDADSLTGALALYEGLEYRAVKKRFVFEKRVR